MDISDELQLALNRSYRIAKKNRHEFVTPEHILLALLEYDTIGRLFEIMDISVEGFAWELETYLDATMPTVDGENPTESIGFKEILEDAIHFARYADAAAPARHSYLDTCWDALKSTWAKVPADALPFSNVWIARETAMRIPSGSVLFLGILNTLRTWNYFDIPEAVYGYANTGGFGIDGYISSMLGASLVHPDKLYFCVAGDLAFFYDMNVLGNRHVGRNVRILLVNNGKGTEFRNYFHNGADFGEEADKFIAAGGHYAGKSPTLVKNYAQDLGFEYLCASNKEEFLQNCDRFLTPEITDRPMLFEAFVDAEAESEALKAITSITLSAKKEFYKTIRGAIPQEGINLIKKILK